MSFDHLFVLGATGYIGGAVLVGIKRNYPKVKITALVRSEKDIPAVKALGVSVIHGKHSDLDVIKRASSQADVVLNAANADDLNLTKAVIAGLKLRAASGTKHKPILVHTSGTGVVMDFALGELLPETKIFSDNDVDAIRSIPPTAVHRKVDLEVFAADEEGHISGYIIAPSTIYGVGDGPVNRISAQIPNMIRVARLRHKTCYIGKGTNVWNGVHIKDVVELYLLVLKLGFSGTDTESSYGKFYFGSVKEHEWGALAKNLAPILYSKGLVDSPEAESVTVQEAPRLRWVANNSRSRSERGFALGWKPKEKSVMETLEEDVDGTIAKGDWNLKPLPVVIHSRI